MMYYVQRNQAGAIIVIYANPQPQPDGTCLTDPKPLPDTDPSVVAFLNQKPPQSLSADQLADLLIAQGTLTQASVTSALTAPQATTV